MSSPILEIRFPFCLSLFCCRKNGVPILASTYNAHCQHINIFVILAIMPTFDSLSRPEGHRLHKPRTRTSTFRPKKFWTNNHPTPTYIQHDLISLILRTNA